MKIYSNVYRIHTLFPLHRSFSFERERDVNFFRQYGQRTKEKKIIHGDLKFSHQLLWENMFYKM